VKMKVGIPTLGNSGLDEIVSPHLGRAPTFTVVNVETGEVSVVPNTSRHAGGRGNAPEQLAENGVQVVLCSGLGSRAIEMFEQFGIKVFVGAEGTVREALEKWMSGELREPTDRDACEQHRHIVPRRRG